MLDETGETRKSALRRNEMMVGAVLFLSLIRRFDALFKKVSKNVKKRVEKGLTYERR